MTSRRIRDADLKLLKIGRSARIGINTRNLSFADISKYYRCIYSEMVGFMGLPWTYEVILVTPDDRHLLYYDGSDDWLFRKYGSVYSDEHVHIVTKLMGGVKPADTLYEKWYKPRRDYL